ncbi:MAG: hypothetical protein JXB15_09620 [Anaerolineales bacterium]|nr:hypothetical protein [Anaerolineales bacterium]
MNRKFWYALALALLAALMMYPHYALADGTRLGGWFPISIQPESEVHPAVAHNSQSGEYLVVVYYDRPGNDDVRALRVSRHGYVLSGVWVSAGPGAERRFPDVAYNVDRNEYLVVWEHTIPPSGPTPELTTIRGQRLTGEGALTGGEIIIADPGGTAYVGKPAVEYAYTSKKYLVVWERFLSGGVSFDICSQSLWGDGTVDGSGVSLAQGDWSYSHRNPDLAYNRRSNGFLVAWERLDKSASITDIFGRLVHGSGGPMPDTIEIMRVSTNQTNPSVASIPTATPTGQFLVAWEMQYAPSDKDIMGRLVNGDGTMGSNATYYACLNGVNETSPAVAGSEDGQQYLLIWSQPNPVLGTTINALTINTAGQAGSEGMSMELGGLNSIYSAVASGPSGDFLVAAEFTGNAWDVIGWLWGNRTYFPLLAKH